MDMQITKDELVKLTSRPLWHGEYRATDNFRAIEMHSCVCFEDGGLVASTGRADDRESQLYAAMFADAPAMLLEIAKLREIAKDAQVLAHAWKMIRAEGLEIVLEQGDPEGIDFVADRVTAAEHSVERMGESLS